MGLGCKTDESLCLLYTMCEDGQESWLGCLLQSSNKVIGKRKEGGVRSSGAGCGEKWMGENDKTTHA